MKTCHEVTFIAFFQKGLLLCADIEIRVNTMNKCIVFKAEADDGRLTNNPVHRITSTLKANDKKIELMSYVDSFTKELGRKYKNGMVLMNDEPA